MGVKATRLVAFFKNKKPINYGKHVHPNASSVHICGEKSHVINTTNMERGFV
jgi:hypothetical protein